MRLLLTVPALAVSTVVAGFLGTQPSQAEVTYPWCAEYSMQGSSNCGFATLQQCQAALSGNGGYCTQNPMFRPGIPGGVPMRR